MAKKKVKKINPYSNPELAMMNADWIKHVHANRTAANNGDTEVAKNYKSFITNTNIVNKGGKGSGNFGHAGRHGKVGGSAKRGHVTAGITPYHETKKLTVEEVNTKGNELAAALKKIKTIKNVSYNGVGSGGWEGGAEPTLIISYDGNGEGIKLMAKYGKEWGQDGVLLRRRSTSDDPGAQPSFVFHFDNVLSKSERAGVEELVVELAKEEYGEANIGWTWWNKDGKTSFDSQSVHQWGGDADKHKRIFDKMNEVLSEHASGSIEYNLVGIMDSDAYDTENGYSKIIEGKDPFEVKNGK